MNDVTIMDDDVLAKIADEQKTIEEKYAGKLEVNPALGRKLVSFQANKSAAFFRWCKYKEGFSASLVQYILDSLHVSKGCLLDPFAGSGTALFVAANAGLKATGIELLPSSADVIEVRRLISLSDRKLLTTAIREFVKKRSWEEKGSSIPFPHLKITAGCFPERTEELIGRYRWESDNFPDKTVGRVLRFAALCMLESISYTRKDGQYLRWDSRSGRKYAGNFDKGKIADFSEAIIAKLMEIVEDLSQKHSLFDENIDPAEIELLTGSCLDLLPKIKAKSIGCIITSPPYCNRYDYTRTYALELAYLGVGETEIRSLRQTMLSCTVENRQKDDLPDKSTKIVYETAMKAFNSQRLLAHILEYLEECKSNGTINNTGIPRMVRHYFQELALTIFECARILKPGAPFVMVNDNVRYQGINIPVDLICSDFASAAGLLVEKIWVLPRGKGNSSQQMGKHGREEMRKCVYIWRAKGR